MYLVSKEFRFEASHILPHHEGKCSRLHGHSWVGEVWLMADVLRTTGPSQGMIQDFEEIKQVLAPMIEKYLDHRHLNETLDLVSPTSERVAWWIFHHLQAELPQLVAVKVKETCTSTAVYSPCLVSDVLNNIPR